MNDDEETQTNRRSRLWNVFGRDLPRGEIVFFCQITLVYVVVIVSLVNLSTAQGPTQLWTALLGSCLGYALPAPSIRGDK